MKGRGGICEFQFEFQLPTRHPVIGLTAVASTGESSTCVHSMPTLLLVICQMQ